MYIKKGYKKPQFSSIITNELCQYGCHTTAKYIFSNGKICCSKHQNSCLGKRKQFSEREDHKERNAKSLQTRLILGITKSSRKKAHNTMLHNGTYEVIREKMQKYWEHNFHQNNTQCPLLPYKTTSINYQGSYEFNFLSKLEKEYGINWLKNNVFRGPSLWYIDTKNIRRLYISDFLIQNTIYEIKSYWTWNKHGSDKELENNNKLKLNEGLNQGYKVILVLEGKEIIYEKNAMG